ncbi:FAD-dependent oxidoreductase-like enzyme [Sarocladium implicatum]|nr:FAD-dependent oxidoreductase-like enzyme [Sarocladium implicatum]
MAATGVVQPNGGMAHGDDEPILNSVEPTTPRETNLPNSQITLPSTEVPNSPMADIDPNESFKTELNDDRVTTAVIPSSLTPPPSSQVVAHDPNGKRAAYTASQGSALFSPPATVLPAHRVREAAAVDDYTPPTPAQIQDAPVESLRAMLQTCVAEHQKLKMEAAHHKLQLNLLNLQAENDLERAAVEHDMVRAEVDAIRSSEYFIQTKRELSAAAEAQQARYQLVREQYQGAMEENKLLNRKVRSAKKVIMQKEEETQALTEERDMLLTRIRENREHFQTLCNPGGILYGALTPKPATMATPKQPARGTPRQTPRTNLRGPEDPEHGLSALLQAMSQDNNSAPSTPLTTQRPSGRQVGKHNRNVQSLSSLPTTPLNRVAGGQGGLLPSVSLVPQTEPPRHSNRQIQPTTPTPKSERRRKSRESTISADENEELARQAMQSVATSQGYPAQGGDRSRLYANARSNAPHQSGSYEDRDMYDSQASQAATEMLRRNPRQSFEVATASGSVGDSPEKMQSKIGGGLKDKRKFSGSHEQDDGAVKEPGSPSKRTKLVGASRDDSRVGLGIQY